MPFVRIEVTNAGHGLREADRPHLFSQFHMVDRVSEKHGLGVGLWALKTVMHQSGGLCGFKWTKRSRDKGPRLATFWFNLPLEDNSASHALFQFL